MTEPEHGGAGVALRLLAALAALAVGVVALLVAILLVKGVLGG